MKRPVEKKAEILFTKEGLEEVQAELESLQQLRPSVVVELSRGREMGDLSENGLYRGAKMKLGQVDARIRHLTRLLKAAKVIQASQSEVIEFGSVVTIITNDKEYTYQIVGGYESNPAKGTVSHHSPLGQALMGKKKGDSAVVTTPTGEIHYTIHTIK